MEVNKMPGGDGTGPRGMGSMTGRGVGYCADFDAPGYMNPMPRRGMGFGRGFGSGFGRGMGWRGRVFVPTDYSPVQPVQPYQPTKEQEIEILEDDAKAIEMEQKALDQEKEVVRKRIEELKQQE